MVEQNSSNRYGDPFLMEARLTIHDKNAMLSNEILDLWAAMLDGELHESLQDNMLDLDPGPRCGEISRKMIGMIMENNNAPVSDCAPSH